MDKVALGIMELPDELMVDFANWRIWAERTARKMIDAEDVELRDIYGVMEKRFNLSPTTVQSLMDIEIQKELDCVRPVASAARLLKDCRKMGKRIVFISNMYLPDQAVRSILERTGILENGDGLYVSGRYGLTKRSGNLFRLVLRRENCAPKDMIHFGDHPVADFLKPRIMGIKAVPYCPARLNRYEQALLGAGTSGGQAPHPWQVLAGASRAARVGHGRELSPDQEVIHRLGANIAGPILLGFVLWVLRKARDRGIRRLYFLARDGQILLHVAQRLVEDLEMRDLELRYLYGSRQAWFFPSIREIGDKELDWITDGNPHVTLATVARRLWMSSDELSSLLRKAGFPCPDPELELSVAEIHRLRASLRSDPAARDAILDHASENRKLTRAYLTQEGLADPVSWALVDTGWYGRMQDALKRMLLEESREEREISGFYFGVRGRRPDPSKVPFLFGPSSPWRHRAWGKAFVSILEVLTAANHGMTVSYRYQGDGSVAPVLKESKNLSAMDWGLVFLRQGIDDFLDSAGTCPKDLDPAGYRERILSIIKRFVSNPSIHEARAFGAYRFSSEQTESELKSFAPALSLKDIIESFWDSQKRKSISFWPEASIVRSSLPIQLLVPRSAIRLAISMLELVQRMRERV